jgi:hypothetical protein
MESFFDTFLFYDHKTFALKKMKKYFLITLSLLILLVSCTSEKSREKSNKIAVTENKMEEKMDSSTPILKWELSSTIKNNLCAAIAENKDLDVALLAYLEAHDKIENELNAELYNLPFYNSLNTLSSSEPEKISVHALEFKKQASKNGFKIDQAEGMIYLRASASSIKADVMDKLSSPYSDFLELYCAEMDPKCCADGAIVITEAELAKRAWQWGELLEEVKDMAFENTVSNEYEKYLSFIFVGIDNTPAFDWQSRIFKQRLFVAMMDIIEKYPDSKVAKEFESYTALLTAEGLKRTNKVETFLNARFN